MRSAGAAPFFVGGGGKDTLPRKVATAKDLSHTDAALYTNGMTAAIKAFDVEEKAREVMKGEQGWSAKIAAR